MHRCMRGMSRLFMLVLTMCSLVGFVRVCACVCGDENNNDNNSRNECLCLSRYMSAGALEEFLMCECGWCPLCGVPCISFVCVFVYVNMQDRLCVSVCVCVHFVARVRNASGLLSMAMCTHACMAMCVCWYAYAYM